MKKTYFLLAMMLLSLSATMSANSPIKLRINGATLDFVQEAVVPESMNEQFLKGVYCGLMSDIKDKIIITDFKHSDNYTIALLLVGSDYYVATYKPKGGVIDGALLLKKNDIVMACDFMNPRGNRVNAKSPSISLEEDKVSVTRIFKTYVNAYDKGGPIITEEGSVTSVYDVDKSGKIAAPNDSQHSKWIVVENTSVPGNRGGKDVIERDACRTLGPGIVVINLYKMPVSQENDETPGRLENLFKQFDGMKRDVPKKEMEQFTSCIEELEKCQKGMILRNPKLWLDWLDKNPDSSNIKVLNKSLEEDKDFKAELLKEVKSLKDKKLRKAWENRLK